MNKIKRAEAILLEKFKTEPFHNFNRLKETSRFSECIGGTCSDKTMSYLKALEQNGIHGYLHTAIIRKQFNHQLARIEYKGNSYFADVGNGWPSIFLYPSDKEVNYMCYGMEFRTEIQDEQIKIFHTRNGRETIQMEFNRNPQPQKLIKKKIECRFSNDIHYPFDAGLRFSLVVEDQFIFIRDSNIYIYSNKGLKIIAGVTMINFQNIVKEYFSFNLI